MEATRYRVRKHTSSLGKREVKTRNRELVRLTLRNEEDSNLEQTAVGLGQQSWLTRTHTSY